MAIEYRITQIKQKDEQNILVFFEFYTPRVHQDITQTFSMETSMFDIKQWADEMALSLEKKERLSQNYLEMIKEQISQPQDVNPTPVKISISEIQQWVSEMTLFLEEKEKLVRENLDKLTQLVIEEPIEEPIIKGLE
jgi:hypothetical protein